MEHLVDVSLEEMQAGRPPRRPLYKWPVCGPCWNRLEKPELSVESTGPMDGPAPARQKEGHIFEICYLCETKTIMGLYLRWPAEE